MCSSDLDNSKHWATHPFSVTVRKRGVHAVAVANIPARATIELSEAKANAQLIAAAPELLEALERAVAFLLGSADHPSLK